VPAAAEGAAEGAAGRAHRLQTLPGCGPLLRLPCRAARAAGATRPAWRHAPPPPPRSLRGRQGDSAQGARGASGAVQGRARRGALSHPEQGASWVCNNLPTAPGGRPPTAPAQGGAGRRRAGRGTCLAASPAGARPASRRRQSARPPRCRASPPSGAGLRERGRAGARGGLGKGAAGAPPPHRQAARSARLASRCLGSREAHPAGGTAPGRCPPPGAVRTGAARARHRRTPRTAGAARVARRRCRGRRACRRPPGCAPRSPPPGCLGAGPGRGVGWGGVGWGGGWGGGIRPQHARVTVGEAGHRRRQRAAHPGGRLAWTLVSSRSILA
jgi:hypothetical protein